MREWFAYNSIDSRNMGLYVKQMPAIVRPAERVEYKTVPGRRGSLSYKQGEHIYDAYTREVTVCHLRSESLDEVFEWLRGSGEVIFSNQPTRRYFADIAAEVSFARVDNDWEQAVITFYCQPYMGQYPPEMPLTFLSTLSVTNPGNIPSRPRLILPALSDTEGQITIGGVTYTFTGGSIIVDCDADIVTDAGGINFEAMDIANGFPSIPTGDSEISATGFDGEIIIEPRWRWV